MKPNKYQKELCEIVEIQAMYWGNNSDISSPRHYNDIEDSVEDIGWLSDESKEQLVKILSNLYHFIKIHNG